MRRRRTFVAAIAAGLLAATLSLIPLASSAQGGAVPATPEDAIAAYVAGIAAGDVEAILAASAVDEMARGFDFQAYTERLRTMLLSTSLAPADYPLFGDMNRYQQAAWTLAQVRNLVYDLLSDETIDGAPIVPADAARIAAFAAAVDPARLAGLQVLDVGPASPELAADERYLQNAARIAASYGADELTERLALIELDGQTYGLGFTLMRYGDAWKVSNQASVIAGTSVFGTPTPMTRGEFDAVTGG
jgi:hypothetical protein